MRYAIAVTVGAVTSLSALAAVHAQVPPADPPTGSMTVTAKIPAAAGTDVRIEALDLATGDAVKCLDITSTPASQTDPASPASAVSFTINKGDCVSATMRMCWGASSCELIQYQDGKAVALGLVSGKIVYHAPDTGGGPRVGGSQLRDHMRLASLGLFGVGACWFVVTFVVIVRRRATKGRVRIP